MYMSLCTPGNTYHRKFSDPLVLQRLQNVVTACKKFSNQWWTIFAVSFDPQIFFNRWRLQYEWAPREFLAFSIY